MKVLLLEDDKDQSLLYSIWLAEVGECRVAHTIQEAVSVCKTFVPDVAVIDVYLPDGHGFDFLACLSVLYPSTRPLMITGADTLEFAIKAVKLGAMDFLVKPLDQKRLRESVLNVRQRTFGLLSADESRSGNIPVAASESPRPRRAHPGFLDVLPLHSHLSEERVLPPELTTEQPAGGRSPAQSVLPLREVERQAIVLALDSCDGNVAAAAASLEVSVSTFYRKMKKMARKDTCSPVAPLRD